MQKGPWPNRTFPMSQSSLLIGRASDCDIVLDDQETSRHHARFFWRGSQLMVEDLGSTNGTLVNGVQIKGAQVLREGDRVETGASIFGVQNLPAAAVSEQTMASPYRAAPSQIARPQAPVTPPPSSTQGDGGFWLAVGGLGTALIAGVVILVLAIAAIWYFSRTPPGGQPVTTITSPLGGSQAEVGAPIAVQATAIDSKGVARMELWVDGALIGQQVSPSPQGQSPLILNTSWTPATAGNHILEVRTFNVDNRQSEPQSVIINAVAGGVAAATSTPTTPPQPTEQQPTQATITPIPTPTSTPTPTLPTQPGLRVASDVNVRTGPSTAYPIIGMLRAGDTALVTGRSADGAWWQIIFPPNTTGLGWIAAAYAQANQQTASVPIVAGPALPPTNTPIPPTATGTPVPPTSTPIPANVEVSFTADDTDLDEGECTKLRWHVKNVAAYWVDGEAGAGDDGKKTVCDSSGTHVHLLRIQKADGSTQDFTVTLYVEGSSHDTYKTGSATIHGTWCFDIDEGDQTSCSDDDSDFWWEQQSSVDRYLNPQNGAKLANMGKIGGGSYSTCANASYSSDEIDGSNDSGNDIPEGTYVCVKTTEGRYAMFRVNSYGYNLGIGYTTWEK